MPRATHIKFKNSKNGLNINHDVFSQGSRATQISLIYGRNGAGKSTFAKDLFSALQSGNCEVQRDDFKMTSGIELADGSIVQPSLFNEDLINEVGYREEEAATGNMRTIVLLGEQRVNREDIEDLEQEAIGIDESLQDKKERLLVLGGKDDGEISEQTETVKKLLKGEGAWSGFRQQATGKQARVTDNLVSDLLAEVQTDSCTGTDVLVEKRKELLSKLSQGQSNQRVNTRVSDFSMPWDLDSVVELLSETPTIRAANDIEAQYLRVLEGDFGASILQLARQDFSRGESVECLLCTQSIEEDLRETLLSALERVLSADERTDLAERVSALADLKSIELLPLELAQKEAISAEVASAFEQARTNLVSILEQFTEKVRAKSENLEKHFDLPLPAYETAVEQFKTAQANCVEGLEQYNLAIDSYSLDLEEFDKLNLSVVSKDPKVRDAALKLISLQREASNLQEETVRLAGELRNVRNKVKQLRSKDLSQDEAMHLMNSYLAVVFADSERLRLEPSEQAYRVLVRGQDVRLENLSTGERNIIALVFFLASIFQGSDDHTKYLKQRFLILDDPISSFDSDNRFGVFLLLRQIIERFATNEDTQIVVTSHDIGFVQDFAAVVKEVNGVTATLRQIEDHQLSPIVIPEFSGYTTLLKKIYDFACESDVDGAPIETVPAGNEMRLVLEAFAQFEVSLGIVDLPTAKVVSALVEGDSVALKRYFDGPIYKLLLHGESHSAGSINAGRLDLGPSATLRERQQIARDLITLISIVSPAHIPAKLKMAIPGRDNANPYEQVGFQEKCFAWKEGMEKRTLAPLGSNLQS